MLTNDSSFSSGRVYGWQNGAAVIAGQRRGLGSVGSILCTLRDVQEAEWERLKGDF